jgi:toxin ParE1/3/4
MPALRFTDAALDDITAIASYVADISGSILTGERLANQLFDRCDYLAALPGTIGRARPELRADMRSSVYKSYVIFFRYEGDLFEVVNVLEGHRDIDAFYRT